jgi:hypothetical protein
LDVAFNEDQNQNRKEHGAEYLAITRRWGLKLIRKEGSRGAITKIEDASAGTINIATNG